MSRIAVVGMACRYPDADTPRQLWENAIAGRRAFRRLPDQRMRLADYWDADPRTPDRFYASNAAVLEGWQFDRLGFKVAGSTFRSTDLTHWLALEVASAALADAGFPLGEGLPAERTAVVVGNTLTGEFARANQLRLRWPYVRRVVAAALGEENGWDEHGIAAFLERLESSYKEPFPAVDEDTLAGALSNTIAGRICNHFDLKGGGFTVDGACSSSLLSVTTACRALLDGDVDVAIAGGVDLSIDPFEIIGFAKTGALATAEMRVYDRGSNGFWPGEGCGMVVLMREEEAFSAGHRVYAVVSGWGVSSDGKGGITRPEIGGYRLALARAYRRAGFGVDTVALFEGHGTGTKVGDATELTALSEARRAADARGEPAVISSIKAMIGHTKAAAGVAGLIKAVLAVHHEVLPPALGCPQPHEVLTADEPALRVLAGAEPWPNAAPVRAGISAMGFGGINTHVVVENPNPRRPGGLDLRTAALSRSRQDAELLVVDGETWSALRERVSWVAEVTGRVSYAQLADLAAVLHRDLRDLPYRAAVVATSPHDGEQQWRVVADTLAAGDSELGSGDSRAFLGHVRGPARIGYLFPGQGSGSFTGGGALRRRFTDVDHIYARSTLPDHRDAAATEVAQPRIVTGSLAGLAALSQLGLTAVAAVGHSLGEITALHWAGAVDAPTVLDIAARRGRVMQRHGSSGTMAGIGAEPAVVESLIGDLPLVVSGYNGPVQTVVGGPVPAVEEVCQRAGRAGYTAARIAVSHAFHSPLVAPAAAAFADELAGIGFGRPRRRIISTVTGGPLPADTDLVDLLHRQITEPVRFTSAAEQLAGEVELLVEVGPGRVLSRLMTTVSPVRVVALDTDDESLVSLLRVAGAAYVCGAAALPGALYDDRLIRPFDPRTEPVVLASPCESAPSSRAVDEALAAIDRTAGRLPEQPAEQGPQETAGSGEATLDLLRELAASRAELPVEMVNQDSRLLDDLHLSSITVGQIVNEAAARIGVPAAQTPANFATASVRELAETLDELRATVGEGPSAMAVAPAVAGAESWARAWTVDLDETPLPPPVDPVAGGNWSVHAPVGHPFAEHLKRRLETAEVGAGVLVCLPADCGEQQLELALGGAKQVLGLSAARFVLVQHGRGAAGLAKTLRLESPSTRVTIVHLPVVSETPDQAVERVVDEVRATVGYAEVHYLPDGSRRVPVLRAMPVRPARSEPALGVTDVLLVTGGGKGITAECALAVAVDSGAAVGIVGRSDPGADPELAANLERMVHHGIEVHYARADVTDPQQVRRAVEETVTALGPVTAILHGAGRNEPSALTGLTAEALHATFAPKVGGLATVLSAVHESTRGTDGGHTGGQLRLVVTLGSIIGRAGLRGEAHYATANEWLADLTTEVGRRFPGCRALCLEWSVWSGVGMGERLSVVEGLTREGVTPISPTQGVAILRRLLADPDTPPVVVISGRTSGIDTIRYDHPELPLLRFVERPLVRYPGVELVTEVELSAGTDPYLTDHRLDDNLLFPAVFGLEAMTQVAAALGGHDGLPVIEEAEFVRPVIVPLSGSTRIRIAVTATADDTVSAVIHSSQTQFAVDHFRARLRFGADRVAAGPPEAAAPELPDVPLDPDGDLYGGILFQGPRFQRLVSYRRAAALVVDAELAVRDTDWFAGFLPQTLLLGDPGVRDALMHGNQVCVPHATLLPVAVERIHPAGGAPAAEPLRYSAVERDRDGDTYVYDVALRDGTGRVLERWDGLRLRAVRKGDGAGPWAPALLGPYLERSTGELLGSAPTVVVEPVAVEPVAVEPVAAPAADARQRRRTGTTRAVARAVGRPTEVRHRPDGRPEIDGDQEVSIAHGAGVTVCVVSPERTACDVETVAPRSSGEWRGLLGPHADLPPSAIGDTDTDTAMTRIWVALECLQKAGEPPAAPLTIAPLTAAQGDRPGWAVFHSGALRIATFVTALRGGPDRVVFGLLIESGHRE